MSATSRIFLSPPFVGAAERRAVKLAFDSGYVAPCGPQVDAFERRLAQLAGRRYAVAVSSGTAALDLAMAELAVGPDTLVIAPTLTFIATVGPAWHRGAELAFVDSDETGNIDVKLLAQALADARRRSPSRPVVVLGVDLYGRCCDSAAIARLCRRFRAKFVCDSAEAVGATTAGGRPAGSAGVMAVYSFNGNKIVTTSGGGALLTDSRAIAERARKRSQQSREPFPWYQHREVGWNYRLSNLLASLGLAQLDRLPAILGKRRANKAFYLDRWGRSDGRTLPPVPGENNWLTIVLAPSRAARDRLLARLAAANCEARPVWKPMHLQPVFRKCRVYGGAVSRRLFDRGVCLPSGTGLTAADLNRVAACLVPGGRNAAV